MLWEFHELIYIMWVLLKSHYIWSHLGSPIYMWLQQYSIMLAIVLFIIADWNAKSRKSRNTWRNRQIWPWRTEWSKAKANRILQEHPLVIANTLFQQHKRRLYTWTSPDGQYWNQTDYILCSQRWRSSLQSAKTRPGADCGSDHKLFIAKFRLKLKKVGKTTRPFRYDLNQIPYDYTLEVTNGLQGLDLIDRAPEELWMQVRDIIQEAVIKTVPKKNKCKKVKLLSDEAL